MPPRFTACSLYSRIWEKAGWYKARCHSGNNGDSIKNFSISLTMINDDVIIVTTIVVTKREYDDSY